MSSKFAHTAFAMARCSMKQYLCSVYNILNFIITMLFKEKKRISYTFLSTNQISERNNWQPYLSKWHCIQKLLNMYINEYSWRRQCFSLYSCKVWFSAWQSSHSQLFSRWYLSSLIRVFLFLLSRKVGRTCCFLFLCNPCIFIMFLSSHDKFANLIYSLQFFGRLVEQYGQYWCSLWSSPEFILFFSWWSFPILDYSS